MATISGSRLGIGGVRLSNKLLQAIHIVAIQIIKNKYTPKVAHIKTQYLYQLLIATMHFLFTS